MTITCIGVRNFSAVPDDEVMRWAEATRKQIDQDLRRFWDVPVPTFRKIPADSDPGGTPDIDAWIYILDDVPQGEKRDGLGWHKFINGWPLAYVLVNYTLNQNPQQTPSRVFSHEILEMIIDPFIEATTPAINGIEYLVEIGDVLAYDAGGYRIDDVLVSGFGTPAYFQTADGNVFAFRGDSNGDPVGGPLPAKAPEAMGTLLCWEQNGQIQSVLLDAALPAGSFPDPKRAVAPPHPGTRRRAACCQTMQLGK